MGATLLELSEGEADRRMGQGNMHEDGALCATLNVQHAPVWRDKNLVSCMLAQDASTSAEGVLVRACACR